MRAIRSKEALQPGTRLENAALAAAPGGLNARLQSSQGSIEQGLGRNNTADVGGNRAPRSQKENGGQAIVC